MLSLSNERTELQTKFKPVVSPNWTQLSSRLEGATHWPNDSLHGWFIHGQLASGHSKHSLHTILLSQSNQTSDQVILTNSNQQTRDILPSVRQLSELPRASRPLDLQTLPRRVLTYS